MPVEIPVVIDIDGAFAAAAARVPKAMQPLERSIEKLNSDLSVFRDVMRKANIDSADFRNAAKEFQNVSMAIEVANDKFLKFSSNAGSIRQLNAELASVNRRWEEMGMGQKFVSVKTGELTAEAKELKRQYMVITQDIQHMGKTLQQVAAEEQRILSLKERGNQKRRYETQILNTTIKTMRVLTEQERILSARLQTVKLNTPEFKALATRLQEVRKELAAAQVSANGTAGALNRLGAGAKTAAIDVNAMTGALSTQSGVVRRLSAYFSGYMLLFAGLRFVRNIRETTAELEMQRVALGGIIQDTEKASSLFREIKAAAIRSPFQIKDLITYTKQLSAYRVETENLFNVTMKLADVSAGLGVDMNRLILAYGQVKAASVLRGQELRQFTEAGIPLVKQLADKFKELGREGTTTADVFKLISARAVPFEMVAEIFDDMTERGGIFYKMQEKQAETLKGQWNNLKDALTIMYDEIGNTSSVHNAMTDLINAAKVIFQNWRLVANAVKTAAIQFGLMKVAAAWLPNLKRELLLAKKAQDALTRSQSLYAYAQTNGSKLAARSAAHWRMYSMLMNKAAMSTNLFTRATLQLRAAMIGTNWIGLAIGAVVALGSVLIAAARNATHLNRELSKISTEGGINITRSVANFERLAETAVNAADGSKEQTAALDELKRTYGDIIPYEQLRIENLRKLAGNYDALTQAIRQKIYEQMREQKINTIADDYGKTLTRQQRPVKKILAESGLDPEQVAAVFDELSKAVEQGLIKASDSTEQKLAQFNAIIKDQTGRMLSIGADEYSGIWDVEYITRLIDTYSKMFAKIQEVNDELTASAGSYGRFAKMAKELDKSLSEIDINTDKFGGKGTYTYNQEKIRQSVQTYWDYIQQAFEEVNKERADKIDISQALLGDGKLDFEFLDKAVKQAMEGGENTRLDAFINFIQEKYEKLVPSDQIVNMIRYKVGELAKQYSVSMDVAQQFYKDADTSVEDWVGSLQKAYKEQANNLKLMEQNNALVAEGILFLRAYSEEEIKAATALTDFLKALSEGFSEFAKKQPTTTGGSYQQPAVIAQFSEQMKYMQDFKRGYDNFLSYMDSKSAMLKQIEIMNARGLSLGIDTEEQKRAATGLSQWYKDLREKVLAEAKKFGAAGTVEAFLAQEIKDTSSRGKALKDFQKLMQSLWDAQTDLDTSTAKDNFERALKKLSDDLKRSKEANDFFNDILSSTGNAEYANTITTQIYGDLEFGDDFKSRIQKEMMGALKLAGENNLVEAPTISNMEGLVKAFNIDAIRKALDTLPPEVKEKFASILSEYEKFESSWYKDFLSTYRKAKDYTEQIADLERQKTQAVNEAAARGEDTTQVENYFKQKVAEVRVKKLKDAYEWTKTFEEIDKVGTPTLRRLITMLKELISLAGQDMTPEDLKALTEALAKAEAGLVERNPFGNVATTGIQLLKAAKMVSKARKEMSGKGADSKEAKDYAKAVDEESDAMVKFGKSLQSTAQYVQSVSDLINQVFELFGADELSDSKAVIDGITEGLKIMVVVLTAIDAAIKLITNTNPLILAITVALGAIVGLLNIINNLKTAAFKREIEAQEESVKNLERSYKRLDEAIKSAFGSEYLAMYNQQIEVLNSEIVAIQKQIAATRKMADASKGDKRKEYEGQIDDLQDKLDDTENKLRDLHSEMQTFLAGTDLTSAAKDFAEAWIEAYKSFGSTTAAMKEKFREMIDNMVVSSLAAKVMEDVLKPVFDVVDRYASAGKLDEKAIAEISALTATATDEAQTAMMALIQRLQSYGISMRGTGSNLTGIGKDIAGASEESILGLAAGINTQNYYMSYVPTISQNVASILALLGGEQSVVTEPGANLTSMFGDEVFRGQMQSIAADMSEVKVMLRSVITPKSAATNTAVIATI